MKIDKLVRQTVMSATSVAHKGLLQANKPASVALISDKKLEKELNAIALRNRIAFNTPNLKHAQRDFYRSTFEELPDAKITPFKKLLIGISPDCSMKLSAQIDGFISAKNLEFYSTFHKSSEIACFENNKLALLTFLKKSPKEYSYTNQEYKNFVQILQENIFNQFQPKKVFKTKRDVEIYKNIAHSARATKYDAKTKKIFYSQNTFANLSANSLRRNIQKRTLIIPKLEIPETEAKELIGQSLKRNTSAKLQNGALIENYSNGKFYDFPLKFAQASYNTLQEKGNAYIQEDIPEVFEGINPEKLFEQLDLLSAKFKYGSMPAGISFDFEIDGKTFKLKTLTQGLEAATFRMSSQGKSVIFKNYLPDCEALDEELFMSCSPSGAYGGIGILREANLANVADVPKLYMANPIIKPVKNICENNNSFKGGWMIVEDVQNKTAPKEGLKFTDWLKEKGLFCYDAETEGNILNGYFVDTGYVNSKDWYSFYGGGSGNNDVNEVFARFAVGKTSEEIIEMLN